jgi:hypothetical protein
LETAGNDAVVAAISFSEIRRNHKRPNQANKEVGNHSHGFYVFTAQKVPLLLLVGERPRLINFSEIRCVFNPPPPV